jgi:hypothetical protein
VIPDCRRISITGTPDFSCPTVLATSSSVILISLMCLYSVFNDGRTQPFGSDFEENFKTNYLNQDAIDIDFEFSEF